MSNHVFPMSLPGLDIKVKREPVYNAQVQETQGGKEQRTTWWTYPRYRYQVIFNVLHTDSVVATRARELQQLLGYLARHFGQFDSFLFTDPDDSSVVDHGCAVGDGATATFQLQRTLAGDIIDAAGFSYHPQTKPYTNLVKNSSFETDTNADGTADNWNAYNNAAATEPAYLSIVPGMNGGKAQRVSWGINTTSSKGVTSAGSSSPAWVPGQWHTVTAFVRASGSNIGKFISLAWNTAPNTGADVSNPALSASWQRYVFQVFWNLGTSPAAELFLTISSATGNAYTNTIPSGTFGDLDFDLVQVVAGQHGVNDFQPIETPAAATGTRTPAYWPGYADGFEPIVDLNGDVTIYEDGTWRGRRTLYPFTRTNLLPWSEQFDNAAWVKAAGTTITANATTAPDGTATADQFNEGTGASTSHNARQQTSPAPAQGELRCYSVFVKANTLSNIVWTTETSDNGINFNLSTGVIAAGRGANLANGVITDPRWPGWYRIWFTERSGVTLSTGAYLAGADGSYNLTYTGTSRTFYAWGAMCERVSNLNGPTPYIPTPSSTAVTVTDYTLNSLGQFTPAALASTAAFFSWGGSYYRRVRFDADRLAVERVVTSLWEAKTVQLITVKV